MSTAGDQLQCLLNQLKTLQVKQSTWKIFISLKTQKQTHQRHKWSVLLEAP